MEFVLVQKKGAFKEVTDFAHRAPGKIPQTPHKETKSFRSCWWNVGGIFQGYMGEILETVFFDAP